jgi:hypothetical protein
VPETTEQLAKSAKLANLKGKTRKGVPNKATKAIKDMIEGALQDVGGQAYLAQQARENPAAFMQLIGKILPKDVNLGGQPGNPVQVTKIELVGFNDDDTSSAP